MKHDYRMRSGKEKQADRVKHTAKKAGTLGESTERLYPAALYSSDLTPAHQHYELSVA